MAEPAAALPAEAAARLAAWLADRDLDPGGAITLEKLPGGQSNPTYRAAAGGRAAFVLRRKPFGALLPSAHAIEREYRVTAALAGGPVPVARPLALCEDATVIGAPFFVMAHVEGRGFRAGHLPDLARSERTAIYGETARVLAALHALEPAALDLDDFGRPSGYFSRQAARWTRQYRASETVRIDAMERLIDWLPGHVPADDRACIVHGDYRCDNIIFSSDAPAIAAVIDWELATIGHPLADLAQYMTAWRLPPDPYRGLAGLDLAALGIPGESAFRDLYAALSGLEIAEADWRFALAFALFRNAAIRQGVLRRALEGNASDPDAAVHGARARDIADLAWRIASGEADARLA